jgi:hypothetical protein
VIRAAAEMLGLAEPLRSSDRGVVLVDTSALARRPASGMSHS